MKKKSKYGSNDASDFSRYSNGEMNGQERNAFEKKLQKDPFSEEAAEGFSTISAEEAEDDLIKLEEKLKSRIFLKNRFPFYRVAATMAVLVMLSALFLTIRKRDVLKEPGEVMMSQTREEKTESAPASSSIAADRKDKYITEQRIPSVPAEPEKESGSNESGKTEKMAGITKEPFAVTGKKASEAPIENETMAEIQTADTRQKSDLLTVRGKIISSEDNLPLAGANILVKGTRYGTVTDSAGNFMLALPETNNRQLVAEFVGMKSKEFEAAEDSELRVEMVPDTITLAEEVVIGSGKLVTTTHKVASSVTAVSRKQDYTPPRPAGGKVKFDRYINTHIRNPLAGANEAFVILGFRVKTSGEIDSIKVISSPGIEFSGEAERLIREGPAWRPAVKNGVIVEDEARVRIVFK